MKTSKSATKSTKITIEAAKDLSRRGFAVVRIKDRSKEGMPGWDKIKITDENAAMYFKSGGNIGVRLGADSNGLVDVDLDCAEAVSVAPDILPPTQMVFGRPSNPHSHYCYLSDLYKTEDRATIQHKDPEGSVICELRIGAGSAALTRFPPSIDASGETVEWYADGEPAEIDGQALKRAVAKTAAAALLARHWPAPGGRHSAAMIVDAYLARRTDLEKEERADFIAAIAKAAGDEEVRSRKRVTERTDKKLEAGKKLPGRPKMIETFGEDVVECFDRILDLDHWDLDDALKRINDEYAVVMDGGKTRILRFDLHLQTRGDGRVVHRRLVPSLLSFPDFTNFHLNETITVGDERGGIKKTSVGHWWLRHPQRRQYSGLIFRPNAEETVDGKLNLWRGWGVEPAPGDWSLMQVHISDVLANGDEEAATYIIDWLAWSVQHPSDRAQVALVFKGGRGTGKGTVGNAMCHIFGQHATHISSVEHLAGRFNAHLRDVCFLFADEAYWPGDKHDEGTLKRLITEPTLFIEAKGRDGVTVENMLHVLMASNADWVVPAGEHERRYAVFQVSEDKRQDEAWFTPLYEQLENGGYAAMLFDLLNRDLGDWHPRRIPLTEALHQQQLRNLDPMDAWLLDFLESGVLPSGEGVDRPNRAISRSKPDFEGRNPRNGLFDLARQRSPSLSRVNDQVLAAYLKKWGCAAWRDSQSRGWEFPPLQECRARWEEKYPGWPWQHPDLTEWQEEEKPAPLFRQDY